MNWKSQFRRIFRDDAVTPLPVAICAVLFLVQLLGSMTLTMVFSFLPQLVKSYGVSEVDTGYYAGLIGSALFAGRFISGTFWGYLCDAKGKKNATILSCVTLTLATIAFGFTRDLKWAFVSRFLQGIFMGVNVTVKAILYDYVDDTNQALGMTMLMCAYSTGLILGPSMAAFLVFPVDRYPHSFSKDSIFGRFVILLPNLLIALMFGAVTIVAYYVIPADKLKKNNERDELLQTSNLNRKYGEHSHKTEEIFENVSVHDGEKETAHYHLLLESVKYDNELRWCCNTRPKCCMKITKEEIKKSRVVRILRKKESVLGCVLYGTYAIIAIGYDELIPLYAATTTNFGGYGFTPTSIGMCLLIVALITVVLEIPLHAKLIRKFGPKKVFIGITLIQSFLFPVHVALANLTNSTVFWSLLFFTMVLVRVLIEGSLVCCALFLNNSVQPSLYGTINGLGMTISALGRTFTPVLFGSLFSWSLTNVKTVRTNKNPLGFPFNQYFSFYVMSMLAIFNAVMVSKFPNSINAKCTTDQEKEPTRTNSSCTHDDKTLLCD